jgi:uncharacterized repeat protein (TIGR01451 family)
MANTKIFESLVLVSQQNGVVVIPEATPLTRLNYFDGKFLRASDLKAEQDYLRQLVRQSNQAGGAGVAYGYDVTLGVGDTLEIGAGLAIDPQGRVLLLPQETAINIQELIEKSRALQSFLSASKVQREGGFELCELSSETPSANPLAASNLFVITISHAEALCGEEDVFGKLCEEACVTSADRPFAVEGLVVRAIPLALQTPLQNSKAAPMTQIHLRSRVASAYFEDERRRVASLISKAGLEQATWCLGADAEGGAGVPIGVFAREGVKTVFLDPWIARRERIDAPAKRYWQWRMMMRPWDVFLAQVLQFQCQLHDLFKKVTTPGGDDDPCGGAGAAIKEAAETIAELTKFYEAATNRFVALRADFAEELTIKGGLSRLNLVNTKLITVSQALDVAPQDRLLIRGGIVELPSAGYLPVVPGAGLTINQQVRRMMGEGVDLRFCVVRHDYVAHALEEAQHMERISLLEGLDDSNKKPQVDILVPDGEIVEQKRLSPGRGFDADVAVLTDLLTQNDLRGLSDLIQRVLVSNKNYARFGGAARTDVLPSGGGAFYLGGLFEQSVTTAVALPPRDAVGGVVRPGGSGGASAPSADLPRFEAAPVKLAALAVGVTPRPGLWIGMTSDQNVFALDRGDIANINARAVVAVTAAASSSIALDIELNGRFRVTQENARSPQGEQVVKGRFDDALVTLQGAAFVPASQRTRHVVDLDVTVRLNGDSAVEITIDHGERVIDLAASWGQQPLQITASITAMPEQGSPTTIPPLATARLKENADALSSTNEGHQQALASLQVVGKALGDPNFADAKAKLLFPPPPKPTDELIVRGTRDWVLFHRRRTKVCSEEKLAPPPPPSRRYQAWHLLAPTAAEATRIITALQNNDTNILSRFQFARVNRVEFGGGVATMLTRPDDLIADWRRVNPGNRLLYSSIASQGGAISEGENLALSRLSRVEDVVDDVSARHADFKSEALEAIPTPFLEDDVDGAIIMLTVNQDVTVSADLGITKTATPSQAQPGSTITYTLNFANNGPNAASNVTVNDALPANITFVSASVTTGSGWDLTTPPVGGAPNVVFSKASVAAGETATFQIVGVVSPNATGAITNTATVKSATADPNAGNDIATATITVIAQTTRTAVVIFAPVDGGIHFPSANSPRATVKFRNNAPEGDELRNLIAGMPPTQFPINGVALAVLTSPVDAGATARIAAVVDALAAAGRPTTGLRTSTGVLSDRDKGNLQNAGVTLVGVDEVIFLEPQR